MQDWLPEPHLARYVVEVIEGLNLSAMERAYTGRGSTPYYPARLLALFINGDATGCYSSRKIERATYDSLASFRRRFAKEIEAAFVQVLQVARENQLSRFGTVSLDGTKIHANASRPSALSYGHAEALEAQLKGEVQQLLALGEAADGAKVPDGMSLPEELKRREERLAAIAGSKCAARAAKAAASGKMPRGKAPKAPTPGPRPNDQINLTDEQSRIMPVAGGGFDQCYSAQAVADTESLLVLVPQVVQAANDKQQVAPMLERLTERPEDLPQPQELLADAGYFSEANVAACEAGGIAPLIAVTRDEHRPHRSERFTEPGAPPPEATAVQRMTHRLKTRTGRATYALRKQTVEPVFAIIKSVMGFRQFLARGLANVENEWTLVCLAWNLERMAVLRLQ